MISYLLCKWITVNGVIPWPHTHRFAHSFNENVLVTGILSGYCGPDLHDPNGLQLCGMAVYAEAAAAESSSATKPCV